MVERNGRKRPHLHFSEAGAEGIQYHQRVTFRLLSLPCSIIVSLKNSSSPLGEAQLCLSFSLLQLMWHRLTHILCCGWSCRLDPDVLHLPPCMSIQHSVLLISIRSSRLFYVLTDLRTFSPLIIFIFKFISLYKQEIFVVRICVSVSSMICYFCWLRSQNNEIYY